MLNQFKKKMAKADHSSWLSQVLYLFTEQLNRSLRKLSTILAYSEWENYLKTLEMFFVTKNLKVRELFEI
jgi:hypothetical protein